MVPPTLFSSGLAGALSIRSAGNGTHSSSASSGSRLGSSQVASASLDGKITGIRLCTRLTTSFGLVVISVQLSIHSSSIFERVHSPAKANGSPPSTVNRTGWRGCFGSSAFIHS